MHGYRILLPSETDDSRFNSREKHMLTDSVQPCNKPIVDLACCLYCKISDLCLKNLDRSDISQYRSHARSISRYYWMLTETTRLSLHGIMHSILDYLFILHYLY
jgi:hypothetical protein